MLGWPVGDGTCWVGIGDNSMMILEDLGSVAGLYDVTVPSGSPRNVVKLELIMDAPTDEDVRSFVGPICTLVLHFLDW